LIIEKISPSGLKTKFVLKGMTSNEVEVSFVGEVFLKTKNAHGYPKDR